jgi:hypothetical protein
MTLTSTDTGVFCFLGARAPPPPHIPQQIFALPLRHRGAEWNIKEHIVPVDMLLETKQGTSFTTSSEHGTYMKQSSARHLLSCRFIFRPWRWTRYVPQKRRLTLIGLHGVISQKIELFIIIYSCEKLLDRGIRKFIFLAPERAIHWTLSPDFWTQSWATQHTEGPPAKQLTKEFPSCKMNTLRSSLATLWTQYRAIILIQEFPRNTVNIIQDNMTHSGVP